MIQILKSSAVVNFILIVIGSLIGVLFNRRISERLNKILVTGMSLSVLYIGISGLIADDINVLTVVLSFAVGSLLGELLNLDKHINTLAEKVENRFNGTKISEGFVTGTLVFCVGAMLIVGSIRSGLSGDNTTLYSKSLIDGITAAAFASTFGIGVMFSAIPVLILEGGLTMIAAAVQPVLTTEVVNHMSVVGSLLIVSIALNMLEITKIKILNLIPSIFLPLIFCMIL
ncbi:MAG: DUF554 domain-containing protein [Clostridia bacterium]|nr:DUF554 domain-containing protein [Clostridia bacterium]